MKIAGMDVLYQISLRGTCPKCRMKTLKEEDNGWFEKAYYCPNCENFFALKLRKMTNKELNKKNCNKIIKKYKEAENDTK